MISLHRTGVCRQSRCPVARGHGGLDNIGVWNAVELACVVRFAGANRTSCAQEGLAPMRTGRE
jgi:hypothetical protein